MAAGHITKCLYPQALFNMKKALSFEPHSYIVNDAIGVVYFGMKQYDQALFYFKKSTQLKPEYTEAQVHLAQTLMQQKKWKEALNHLETALQDLTYINPSKVHASMGEIYFNQKKYNTAKKHLTTSLQIRDENCSNFLYLGRIYAIQQLHKKAIHQFEKVRKCRKIVKKQTSCEKEKMDEYYFQAVSEIKIGRKNNAVKNLKLFIRKNENSNPYYTIAQNLLKNLEK